MGEMKVPEWVGEVKLQALNELGVGFDNLSMGETKEKGRKFELACLEPVVNYSSHFAEWEVKESDLLLHLFPRGGGSDIWFAGKYTNRCLGCDSEVENISRQNQLKPCPKCGSTKLKYIPGRLEQRSKDIEFPANVLEFVEAAANVIWMGNVAIDYIEELGAIAVQFHDAKNTVNTLGPGKFVDKFCETFDRLLDSGTD